MKPILFILSVFFLFSCSKKEENEAIVTSTYKVVPIRSGGSINGAVKTGSDQKFLTSIAIQKDQDVCGASHPNPAAPGAGGVPNCLIGIQSISAGKDFVKKDYLLDQKSCDFSPHVQIVTLGSKIIVSNSDKVLHNYHIYQSAETVVNEAQPEGAPPREVELTRKGLYKINCDIHPWMRGFIWIADHPYYTISDGNGSYTLDNIPPGKYKLMLWRDNWNVDEIKNKDGVIESYKWGSDFSKEQEVTVEEGKEVKVDFTIP